MSQKKYASLQTLQAFLTNLRNTFSELSHKHTIDDMTDYVVDTELSATSTNPVQNKVLEAEFDAIAEAMSTLDMVVEAIRPKRKNVTLYANNWAGDTNPWYQVVTINGVTENSNIDLRATATQIVELQNSDIALVAENDGGVVTVYALGDKPTVDYTIQAEITEVIVV